MFNCFHDEFYLLCERPVFLLIHFGFINHIDHDDLPVRHGLPNLLL